MTSSPVSAPTLEFRPYQPQDAAAFRALNEAWITRYFALEEEDRRTLEHPQEHVLDRGGHIFMDCADGEPVGCCALIAAPEAGVYELAKMAVTEHLRGLGMGRKLIVYVIEQARSLGATRLTLESNSVLANAVHLYESVGFRHLPPERLGHSPYARADIHMEMILLGAQIENGHAPSGPVQS